MTTKKIFFVVTKLELEKASIDLQDALNQLALLRRQEVFSIHFSFLLTDKKFIYSKYDNWPIDIHNFTCQSKNYSLSVVLLSIRDFSF